MQKWNRREFTRNAALATLFSPFVSLFGGPSRATAQAGRAKYLLIFFTNGTDPSLWHPAGSSPTNLAFSQMTAPLAPLRENLILTDRLDSLGTAGGHAAPGGLTGKGYGGQNKISLDQFVADGLQARGISRPFSSLILGGVRTEQQSTFFRENRVLSPIFSPATAFDTVFAGATPGGGGSGPSDLVRRRRSMLDLLQGQLSSLSSDLGSEERQKLELHADSLRQFEERLGGSMEGGAPSACAPARVNDAGQDVLNSALHLDIAVQAFACDLTRVAAVEFGNHQNCQIDIPEVGAPCNWHNDLMHSDGPPRTRLVNLERWLCERFVETAQRLKSIPAPTGGGTLFDQTLMIWGRDMGDSIAHAGDNMRFVISGGAGGYLRRSPNGVYVDGGRQAHQRVLLNCAEAMGVTNFDGFGEGSGDAREPLASIGV